MHKCNCILFIDSINSNNSRLAYRCAVYSSKGHTHSVHVEIQLYNTYPDRSYKNALNLYNDYIAHINTQCTIFVISHKVKNITPDKTKFMLKVQNEIL